MGPDQLPQRPVPGIALGKGPHRAGSSPKTETWAQAAEEKLGFIPGEGEWEPCSEQSSQCHTAASSGLSTQQESSAGTVCVQSSKGTSTGTFPSPVPGVCPRLPAGHRLVLQPFWEALGCQESKRRWILGAALLPSCGLPLCLCFCLHNPLPVCLSPFYSSFKGFQDDFSNLLLALAKPFDTSGEESLVRGHRKERGAAEQIVPLSLRQCLKCFVPLCLILSSLQANIGS